MASRSAEQYLKILFALEGDDDLTMTQIAHRLGVSSASVTGMAKRLSSQGLLQYQPYGGIQLTPEGRDIAIRLLRRHRIAELYLSEKLGYPLYLVHDEADALEHHISTYLEEKMSGVLGHPQYDPHGHPIPAVDGRLPDVPATTLLEAEAGTEVRTASVPDHDPLFLRHLVDIGCLPGSHLTILRSSIESSTVTFALNGREHSLSREKAAQITVCVPQFSPCTALAAFLERMHSRKG
ncbi:MAG: metal-dependent transcriptional regulator [Bacteroidetes bacterium]|nr:metal-dependent transcriptional regulator [Bacteroidota bacterium]